MDIYATDSKCLFFVTSLSCSKVVVFLKKGVEVAVSRNTVIIISTSNYHFKKTLLHHKGH